jgi:hypothetical protein
MIDPTAFTTDPLDDLDPEPDELPETRGKPGRPKRVKPKGWDVPVPEVPFVPAWASNPALLPKRPPGATQATGHGKNGGA